jgi:hypothetical protein
LAVSYDILSRQDLIDKMMRQIPEEMKRELHKKAISG